MQQKKRLGRPPKGTMRRRGLDVYLEPPMIDALCAAADHRGITVSDLVGELLAEHFTNLQKN